MRSRKLILMAIVGAMVLAVTAPIAFAQDEGDTTPAADDGEKVVFTIGDTSEPSSLNPMAGYLATDFIFWNWAYHLPITFAMDDLSAVPDMVTDVQTSEDGMTFVYTLDDTLTWSDGQPVTAEDFEFTMNLYKDNHAYLPQNYLTLLESIEVTGPNEVTLVSTEPTSLYSGDIPYMYTYILPQHIWEGLEKPKQFKNIPMVGSGPFIVTEYETGQFVRMERNPEWEGTEPAMDEIIYQIFKSEDAEAEALKAGEIDFAYIDSANIYNDLATQPNIETMAGTIPSFDEIAMNTGSSFQDPEGAFEPHGDGHPALTDPVVRQAIRKAINSEEITEKVLLGYGLPGTSIIPPVSVAGARWEPTGEEVLTWDIPAANQMLEDAGYVDTDDDGVREMPEGSLEPGRPLEFRYYTQTNDQNTINAAPFIQEWLSQIGIDAKETPMTSGRLGDEINAGTFDLFHWGWIPDPDPDSALSWFQCEQRPPDGAAYGNNDSYYCNPEYDEMYLDQRQELDTTKRFDIVQQMQQRYYEDSPYAVLWYAPYLQAYRSDLFNGYQPQPAPQGDLLAGYTRQGIFNIEPASGSSTQNAADSKGGSPLVWILLAVVVVIAVIGGIMLSRRRSSDEDRA
ncbi:MAG: ABC transporter substrate-binding protein [Actinomycetota bacterium]